MFFLGSGSLLSQAVHHTRAVGINIDLVCCPFGDSALPRLKKLGVPVLESNDPNVDLLPHLNSREDSQLFSLNNKHILTDAILKSGPECFNIHNGLVQKYRGLAEICIFAALCNGEDRYGVTLQKLLPNQKVDAGPILAQRAFLLNDGDSFHQVMKRSLDCCVEIFKDNIVDISKNIYDSYYVEVSQHAYSYKDIGRLCAGAGPDRFSKASNLGPYRAFFPRLMAAVSAVEFGG